MYSIMYFIVTNKAVSSLSSGLWEDSLETSKSSSIVYQNNNEDKDIFMNPFSPLWATLILKATSAWRLEVAKQRRF